MTRFVDWLQFRICVTNWGLLPAPVWALIAAPLLHWAMGSQGRVFHWPHGASRSPLRMTFWWVGYDDWRREHGPFIDLEEGDLP